MFARRYFAPRYFGRRYWVKASVAPETINVQATPKLASHVDLPRPADTTSAFGRWADDLIRRLQRAFETIIYTLNALQNNASTRCTPCQQFAPSSFSPYF